jgi:hypothetical protein
VKTYFEAVKDSNGDLKVTDDAEGYVYLWTSEAGRSLPAEEVPALCLALLEAAGEKPNGYGGYASYAAHILQRHIKRQEALKAKAADEKELLAEAERLFNVGKDNTVPFTFPNPETKKMYLRIAKEARKIAEEKA